METDSIMNRNKTLVKNYIERVINTGETATMAEFIHPDYQEIYQGKVYRVGLNGAMDHIRGVRQTYPDLHLRIDAQLAERDTVVTMYTMTGTHQGVWLGIKPTGQILTITGINVDRIKDQKIFEHGGAANLFEGLLAAGAIKLVTE